MFACIHLNAQAFFALLFVGLLLGAVYYLTNSLLYCVIIHGIHNFFVYLLFNKLIAINGKGFINETNIPDEIQFQPLGLVYVVFGTGVGSITIGTIDLLIVNKLQYRR